MNRLLKLKILAQHQNRMERTAERRRRILITNLEEQLKLVQALIDETTYTSNKKVWRTNENGDRVQIERPKRMRVWFWINWSGVCFFQVWYGSKIIQIKPGKTVVEAENKEKLAGVILSIIGAVKCGDLDIPIEDVAENGLAQLRLKYKTRVRKEVK